MSRFLLIRHGHHSYIGRRLAGWLPGIHLSEQGRSEAARLAESLGAVRIDALISSPLERCMETAETLARRLRLPVEVEEAFGEVRFGDWTDLDFETLDRDPLWGRYNQFRSMTRPPGGELIGEVQARFVSAMERLRSERPGKTIAVVSHGDPIRSAVAYYAAIPLDLFTRIEISPASVTAIELRDWGPVVLTLNATCDGARG